VSEWSSRVTGEQTVKKLWIALSVIVAVTISMTWPGRASAEETVGGDWNGAYTGIGGERLVFYLSLKQDGENVTGTTSNPGFGGQSFTDRPVRGTFKDGELVMGSFKGTVKGDTMVGTFPATAGPIRNFTATRVKK
jgi:hypothetical protein